MRLNSALSLLLLFPPLTLAQTAPNPDAATFDSDGAAHVTRFVPLPATLSPEARQWLKEIEHESPQPKDLAEARKRTDE